MIEIIEEPCSGFRIRLGLEGTALLGKGTAQLTVVFENTVVDEGNPARLMGMGVGGRGAAMSRPAGVADAAAALQRGGGLDRSLTEIFQPSSRFEELDAAAAGNRNTCRVIASVFQPGQRIQKKLLCIF